jgi:hypothetical protein
MDYLILGFDERGALTTLVWPEICAEQRILQFGMEGYRDHLCQLITETIDDADVTAEETIIFTFRNQTRLRIPLRRKELPGERAIFNAPKQGLYVW